MSTLRIKNIAHPSSTTSAITLNADGSMGGSFPYPNRNLLYNGAMQVHQRGTSVTGITSGGYLTADRFSFGVGAMGTWTNTIENDAPTGSGLRKSFKVLCTTAAAAPGATGSIGVTQILEGQDVQRIAKGTASAQQLTLSFWVKSNVTGTYIAELVDIDNTRRVSASYSVNASATWEKKSLTYPADTTGAFDNDNAASLVLRFWLGSGSDFTGGSPLQTAWGTATNTRATGQTNLAAATNNYWQITGVQLEVGPNATEFEFKSFGQELLECQRYYYRIQPNAGSKALSVHGRTTSATVLQVVDRFPVQMRVAPTALEQSGTAGDYDISHASTLTQCNSVPAYGTITTDTFAATNATVASGLTAGQSAMLRTNSGSTAGYLAWSAEL